MQEEDLWCFEDIFALNIERFQDQLPRKHFFRLNLIHFIVTLSLVIKSTDTINSKYRPLDNQVIGHSQNLIL